MNTSQERFEQKFLQLLIESDEKSEDMNRKNPQTNRNYKMRILTLKVYRILVMNLKCPGQQLHQLMTDGFSQESMDRPPTFLVAAILSTSTICFLKLK
ncbi:unnamed protein product [Haemonchus placei]|uniref:Uncharacterized protein n=1 Tax=Haemonchus placei TaxID=6290 RepID=A0A0N4WCE5_HAEPC|nr:unnamed protein product [Haemonchus placei]